MANIADQERTINCIANTPLELLIPGVTRVRSQNTGRMGTIYSLDYNTRYGPENPDVLILWDGNDVEISGWWWEWFTTVDVVED